MASAREKILQHIKTKGWSMITTAERAGIPHPTIKSIIYGKSNNQRIATLEKLAKVFGCSISDLVGDVVYSNDDKINPESKIDPELFKECLDAVEMFLKKKNLEIQKEKLMIALENLFSLFIKKKNKGLAYSIDDETIEWIIDNTK